MSGERKPKAFRLEDAVTPEAGDRALKPIDRKAALVLEPDAFAAPPPPPKTEVAEPPQGRFSIWSKMLLSSVFGLLGLAISASIYRLIDDLFAAHPSLGWLGLGLTALLVLAILGLLWREVRAILRLKTSDQLRADAERALADDNGALAKQVVRRLIALQADDPATASARARMEALLPEIIDGRALIGLADRTLLQPRDELAKAAIASAAKRVSTVTAISPRALVDILFVGAQSVMLVRRIAEIYGVRPGALGFWRLGRRILGHLAITGGVAMTDSVLSQLVGHGLAARVSAKLGEGVLNGLLTARVGLACITVCRPMAFADGASPSLQDVAGEILSNPFGKSAPPDAERADQRR